MQSRLATPAISLCVAISFMAAPSYSTAQQTEGDQFLDGIGETALVARFIFDGNVQDSSRHQRHGSFHGASEAYVDDDIFGQVLSLTGGKGGFVQLRGDVLVGLDSISITGWVYLRGESAGQRFFDCGQGTTAYFFCSPIGANAEEGMHARITKSGSKYEQGPISQRIVNNNKWVHLAVVLDATTKTLTTYADGKPVGQASDVELTLEDVLSQDNAEENLVYLGKSQFEADETIDANLHDVRIYSVALTAQQVATINRNALSDGSVVLSGRSTQPRADIGSTARPSVVVANVAEVPDVQVTTVAGHVPRIPLAIPVIYRDGSKGPDVRVVWPAPRDNEQTLTTGVYTVTGVIPGTDLRPKAIITVVRKAEAEISAPNRLLEAFPLGQIVLNVDEQGRETPFIQNRDKFIHVLLETDPDAFLYMFRNAFGQEQPEGAEPLGVWDSQTTRLRGHASGHYLTAIAQAYASTTYDEAMRSVFESKMNYLIDTIHDLSQKSGKPVDSGGMFNADPETIPVGMGKEAYDSDLSVEGIRTDYWNWGEGFISAYPPDQFIMLEQGATYGGQNNQVWAPYYTLHKILAGLLDCYEVGGNERALEVARNMGHWVHKRLQRVPSATRISMWNRYIAGEYGGMNEVMARLYRLTDDRRFLDCAQLFDNTDFFFGDAQRSHGLARNVDTIRGKHANQHIPQIIGALETYRCTSDPQYYSVAENFWHRCTGSYMYAIGGVAGARTPNNAECFTAEPDTLYKNGFSPGGQNETCATYNLLKLSRQLFLYSTDAKYMDYYEQALYNHILASVAEDDPGNTYHVPLNPGSRKQFGNASMKGFTCCNGTAIESSTKLQDSIYSKSADNQSLYVNLFVPSTLNWADRNVVVKQLSSFPYSDRTTLVIDGTGDFDVFVRIPHWAVNGIRVSINGKAMPIGSTPGKYLRLNRGWKKGDTIEIQIPFSFRLSRIMDQPNIASIFYGPVLMAIEEPNRLSEWRHVALNVDGLDEALTGDSSTLRFRIGDLQLKPFFETYGRYSIYVDVASE